jgi:hypothetical protein
LVAAPRQAARQRKKERFTSLFHHLSIELLRQAFFALKREIGRRPQCLPQRPHAAPGVDGLTWRDYEADLDRRIEDLHARVHRGAYRALPSRRRYIPKADGQQRPLAVAAPEDKIVQGAACVVLNVIYEEDFLGFSYGFRPKRNQHDVRPGHAAARASISVSRSDVWQIVAELILQRSKVQRADRAGRDIDECKPSLGIIETTVVVHPCDETSIRGAVEAAEARHHQAHSSRTGGKDRGQSGSPGCWSLSSRNLS